MKEARTVVIATFVIAVLSAQVAGANNCVNALTRGSSKEYLCTVRSDFGSRFNDCFTFTKESSDRFVMNVQGLTSEVAPGACNAEGSLSNPRFGQSYNWLAQFAFPRNSPLTINFTGFEIRDGSVFYGHGINEYGDRFYYRCRPDRYGSCPLVRAPLLPGGKTNWVRRAKR